MYRIIIYQENSKPIVFKDNIKKDNLNKYKEEFKNIFSYNEISIISSDDKICLIRPSKIISVLIEKITDNESFNDDNNDPENNIPNDNVDENEENIITDGE